jgi:hypothetical protein
MKPIKIVPENKAFIEAALKAVNSRAYQHTYSHYSDIERLALDAERELETTSLPKAQWVGAEYSKQSGGYLAKAYGNKAASTDVTIERRSSGWYLTKVFYADLWPKMSNKGRLALTQEQLDEAVKRLRNRFNVVRSKKEAA